MTPNFNLTILWLLYWFSKCDPESREKICEFSFCLFSEPQIPQPVLCPPLWGTTSGRYHQCVHNGLTFSWNSLVLYSCSYTYNCCCATFFLRIASLSDKWPLREKSSKCISSLSWVTMCVLGTKPFSIFGRSLIVSTVPKFFSREKHHCTTYKSLHL